MELLRAVAAGRHAWLKPQLRLLLSIDASLTLTMHVTMYVRTIKALLLLLHHKRCDILVVLAVFLNATHLAAAPLSFPLFEEQSPF